MAEVPLLELNSGTSMPTYGLGTFLCKPGGVGAAVEAALRLGYRHIDCAHVYANEVEIGEALTKCFKEGVVKREDVFVTSKLWNASHENVLPACQLTLKNLQLDYLDLYLIHWPVSLKPGAAVATALTAEDKLGYDPNKMAKCWQDMEDLVARGLVKAIGISNFTITKTERLLQTAKMVPAVNQVECNPYFQQQKLKEYCDSKGIIFEAYSPLGNPGLPGNSVPPVLEDPVIGEIAAKHGVTPAQVCLAFPLHRGMVTIPKSTNPARIEENLKAIALKLDAEDMKRLREIEEKSRVISGRLFFREEDTMEDFWDVVADEKFDVKPPDAKKARSEE